jgi:TIGR03009 family protein
MHAINRRFAAILEAVSRPRALTRLAALATHSHEARGILKLVLAAFAVGGWLSAASAQTRAVPKAASQPRTTERGGSSQGARTASRGRNESVPAGNAPDGASPANRSPAPGQGSAPVQSLAPAAPFVLTEAQEKLLDQILLRWEQQSDKVRTFKCGFTRWEIDPAFGPKQRDFTLSEAKGDIKYKSPDRGEYRVSQVVKWDGQKLAYVPYDEGVERWICDGEAIYEFDARNKQLKVRPLPEEMRGKAISDGPLPFIFGAQAEQLKRRYWLRDVTPKQDVGKKIWLDARPKFQQDAANFQRATVVLSEKDFLPEALQIFPPGIAPVEGKPQAYTAYGFASPLVNDPLAILKGDFSTPRTPPFWKRVVVEDPAAQGDAAPRPAGDGAQAQRRAVPTKRK